MQHGQGVFSSASRNTQTLRSASRDAVPRGEDEVAGRVGQRRGGVATADEAEVRLARPEVDCVRGDKDPEQGRSDEPAERGTEHSLISTVHASVHSGRPWALAFAGARANTENPCAQGTGAGSGGMVSTPVWCGEQCRVRVFECPVGTQELHSASTAANRAAARNSGAASCPSKRAVRAYRCRREVWRRKREAALRY